MSMSSTCSDFALKTGARVDDISFDMGENKPVKVQFQLGIHFQKIK